MSRVLLLSCVPLLLLGARAGADELAARLRAEIVSMALDQLGVPYRRGSTDPQRGLDCSGFVRSIYQQAGLELPRASAAQYAFTQPIDPQQVSRGDLVFFDIRSRSRARVNHVGIYLGAGYFAHASPSRGIIVDHLSEPYYQQRFVAIRRHPDLGPAAAGP